MKIAFNINSFSNGGGERMQQFLMAEFAKRGHQILMVMWQKKLTGDIPPYPIEFIPLYKNKIINHLNEIVAWRKILNKNEVDCVVMFGSFPFVALGTYFSKRKILISTLRTDPRFGMDSLNMRIQRYLSLKLSKGIVFQTEKVQQSFPVHVRKKSFVIHNPIFIDNIPDIKKERVKRIVAIGRLSEEKNFEGIIRAFARCEKKDFSLHIYGTGTLKKDLESLINALNMNQYIFLEGYVENTLEIISNAEIFVLNSFSEGMPNALIEAMAMGLACISTDFASGAASELTSNGERGILIPVGDESKLQASIQRLIDNTDLRKELQQKAPVIRELLDRKTIVDNWLSFIEETNKHNK